MIKGDEIVTTNRKAHRDYTILDIIEAGIVLKGAEVKSLRERRANINDSFGRIEKGQVFLYNFHITPYRCSTIDQPDPLRPKKLLLHKHQIRRLIGEISTGGKTLVPLKIYFKKGKAKVELALAQGKKKYDKRRSIREKEQQRRLHKILGSKKKWG